MIINLFGGGSGPTSSGPFYHPYKDASANHIYNLLYCDNLALFKHDPQQENPLTAVLSDSPERQTLARIGNDLSMESRVRAIAFNRLRAINAPVPRQILLGTIIEVPQRDGLDVLAVYADGRLRYINQSEKIAIFEDTPSSLSRKVAEVLRASQDIVDRLGPHNQPRRPPPTGDLVRITFLVSDGVYLGEGSFDQLFDDEYGGPVLGSASELLNMLVDVALEQQNSARRA